MQPLHLAIVGGGFTGIVFAAHAIRASRGPLSITVIEPGADLGRGLAYGTRDRAHRINVPSQRMVVLQEDPDRATRWFFAQGILPDARSTDARGDFYVAREDYGSFMEDFLRRTLQAAGDRIAFRHEVGTAAGLRRSGRGWQVELRSGGCIDADVAALCFGHAVPALPCPVAAEALAQPKFVANPWAPGALASIGAADRVLVAGTGLTMADTVTSLLERQHRGPIAAVSRRGLLPRTHGRFINDRDLVEGAPAPTALGLLRLTRRLVRRTSELGWQPAIDSIRSGLPVLWAALPVAEKQRVMRRLLPFWEVHRFRIAPQVDAALAAARAAGQFTVTPAALARVAFRDNAFLATLRRAGGRLEERSYDAIVLCTGPHRELRANPLVAALLASGLARLDEVGIGLAVDGCSRVIDGHDQPHEHLLALGPLTRGTFGEMTGAPDIARHVETVAKWLFSRADQRGA